MRPVLHNRKSLAGISTLLREPARRFPKGGPRLGTSSGQHAAGERRLAESSGFFALTVAFNAYGDRAGYRLRRKRRFHFLKMTGQRPDAPCAKGELLG